MSEHKNGVNGVDHPSAAEVVAALHKPALKSFAISQKLALETTKFWTKRMHAYADQMAMLVQCTRPDQLMVAQAQFIERMQEDYVAEREALSSILLPAESDARPNA
jgi:hypothetical protein